MRYVEKIQENTICTLCGRPTVTNMVIIRQGNKIVSVTAEPPICQECLKRLQSARIVEK